MIGIGPNIWRSRSGGGGAALPASALLICDGDSKTAGLSAPGNEYPAQLLSMISTGATTWTVTNVGVSGKTAAQLVTDAPAKVDTLITAGIQPVKGVLFFAGTNDIIGGATAAATKASIDTYVAARLSAGATFVWVCTMDDRSALSAPQITERLALNVSLRSAYASTIIDATTIDSRFNDFTDPQIWADGTHENGFGYSLKAKMCADKLVTSGYVATGAFVYSDTPTFGTAAGTLATWGTTTLSATNSDSIYWTTDGTDPAASRDNYVRVVPIVNSMTMRVRNMRVHKYPKEATATYTVTQAFNVSTLFTTGQQIWIKKGGASGSTWTDASGNSRTVTFTGSPTINGNGTVSFNGTSQVGLSPTFTVAQPFSRYSRVKIYDHSTFDRIIDGNGPGGDTGEIQYNTSPQISGYAGSTGATYTPKSFGVWTSLLAVYNGAAGGLQVDMAAITTANLGAASSGGFGVAGYRGGGLFVQMDAAEAMQYNVAHTQAERDAFAMYMRTVI